MVKKLEQERTSEQQSAAYFIIDLSDAEPFSLTDVSAFDELAKQVGIATRVPEGKAVHNLHYIVQTHPEKGDQMILYWSFGRFDSSYYRFKNAGVIAGNIQSAGRMEVLSLGSGEVIGRRIFSYSQSLEQMGMLSRWQSYEYRDTKIKQVLPEDHFAYYQ